MSRSISQEEMQMMAMAAMQQQQQQQQQPIIYSRLYWVVNSAQLVSFSAGFLVCISELFPQLQLVVCLLVGLGFLVSVFYKKTRPYILALFLAACMGIALAYIGGEVLWQYPISQE